MSGAFAMRVNEQHLKETLEQLVELHPGLVPGGPRGPLSSKVLVPCRLRSTVRSFMAWGKRAWPVQPLR